MFLPALSKHCWRFLGVASLLRELDDIPEVDCSGKLKDELPPLSKTIDGEREPSVSDISDMVKMWMGAEDQSEICDTVAYE